MNCLPLKVLQYELTQIAGANVLLHNNQEIARLVRCCHYLAIQLRRIDAEPDKREAEDVLTRAVKILSKGVDSPEEEGL